MNDANNLPGDGFPDDQQRRARPSPPPGLADRLERLRSLYAAQRMECAEQPGTDAVHLVVSKRTLSILICARLRELRALDELARYLHRGQLGPVNGSSS